jgi:hypothetical protein
MYLSPPLLPLPARTHLHLHRAHPRPPDFTFVCPTEIVAFSDRIKEFKDINCEVGLGA